MDRYGVTASDPHACRAALQNGRFGIVYLHARSEPGAILSLDGEEIGDEELNTLRDEPWGSIPSFSCREQDPPTAVSRQDLNDFFGDPDNTDCPEHIKSEAVKLIFRETGGAFEATVELIEQAEQSSWYDLLARLQAQTPPEPTRPNVRL